MTQMIILGMLINNFKGIKHLEINFNADETHIGGANGTGKSSIADAFSWVMFGKDAQGNASGSDNFREKPLDDNGNEIHNLTTSVELNCLLDGKPFVLKRTQAENWVKKRGYADAIYSGNVSTYSINGVDVKLTEFKAKIAQIVGDEEIFRLTAILGAFNALEWKKRRAQLITLTNADIDDMLLAKPEYSALAIECGKRGLEVDDIKKALRDACKKANAELATLPARIDEANHAIPEVNETEIADARFTLDDTQKTIESINEQIASIKAGNGEGMSRAELLVLEQELVSRKQRITTDWMSKRNELGANLKIADSNLMVAVNTVNAQEGLIAGKLTELSKETLKRDALRKDYKTLKDKPIEYGDDVCPTCGQVFPPEKLETLKANAERIKAEQLAEIQKNGVEAANNVKRIESEINEINERLKDANAAVDKAKSERTKADKLVMQMQGMTADYSTDPRIAELEQMIDDIKRSGNLGNAEEKIASLIERKTDLQKIVSRQQMIIARVDIRKQAIDRVKELEQRQKEVGAQVTELEQLVLLADKFVTDRSNALEDDINSYFPTIKWKLFDTQINGGMVDTCTCEIPCASGLVAYECANTAAQVNADLEIINVLSNKYNVKLPLFVDNAERVNKLGKTDTQLITLTVTNDKTLTIA